MKSLFKTAILVSALLAAPASLTAQSGSEAGTYSFGGGAIKTNLRYSERMFDRQDNVTDKVGVMLRARRDGALEPQSFYLGGRLFATQIFEKTNTAGKFPILSRLPPTHTTAKSDSYGVLNEASLNMTVTLPWVTAFAQGEHTEVEYPGQDDTQLRSYWVVAGDLSQSPFYAAFGRKTVNFGNFATYAPFTHSHNNHYFWAQSDDPLLELGYLTDRTSLAFSLIPAHRGNRVLSSPKNNGDWSNFAVNGSHRLDLPNSHSLTLGAGFLRGTIYDSTIAHHPPGVGVARGWNNAVDLNATYSGGNFDLMAEHTFTTERWPATGHAVSATTLQGRYRSELFGKPTTYSLSLSRGEQGTTGTEWEFMNQAILGIEVEAAPHMTLGAEYMFNDGFVPLILPRITGDRSVQSHSFLVGAKLTF